jgi:hypothetical protein
VRGRGNLQPECSEARSRNGGATSSALPRITLESSSSIRGVLEDIASGFFAPAGQQGLPLSLVFDAVRAKSEAA